MSTETISPEQETEPQVIDSPKSSETFVSLQGINKYFGSNHVIHDLDLSLDRGELVGLLGPSGCGKTTVLRILSGLEKTDSGAVYISGRNVTSVPVRRRNIGIVFQSYSLFPHMTALENVAYGLSLRRVNKSAKTKRSHELLEMVGLVEHAEKYPGQMSGGQQQRVALARALATEPAVLLLDEPLSALDAKVRVQLREEIRNIQTREGITTLMVTHDQEEALTMSDRVGVMLNGRIEQIGDSQELYHHPSTPFIASFIGSVNKIPAHAHYGVATWGPHQVTIANEPSHHGGEAADDLKNYEGPVNVLIRPEDIRLRSASSDQSMGTVESVQLRGAMSSVTVTSNLLHQQLRVDLATPEAASFHSGDQVDILCDRTTAVVEKRDQ